MNTEGPRQQPELRQISEPSLNIDLEGLPVGFNIKHELVSKISQGDFIDFRDLLKKTNKSDSEKMQSALKEALGLKGNEKADPLPFLEWQEAWNIFVAILMRTQGSQKLYEGLAHHHQTVMRLFKSGKNWRLYDEETREALAKGFGSWGAIKQEIYNRASESQAEQNKPQGRKAHCFSYNKFGHCGRQTCNYRHTCSRCITGRHAASLCPFKQPAQNASPFRFTLPWGSGYQAPQQQGGVRPNQGGMYDRRPRHNFRQQKQHIKTPFFYGKPFGSNKKE